jgi:S1-C subfamily serine protease
MVTVTALGTVGIAAGVVLGAGAASQPAPPVVARASTAQVQPAVNGFGGFGGHRLAHDALGPAGYGAGSTVSMHAATRAKQVGIVDINSVLGNRNAQAAGTGMLLTSNGEVLTNNHVVRGATGIAVTVVSTGASYTATVLGTDPSADVAVLHLAHASGLATAKLSASPASVGEAVTAVGNAGGAGTLTAASGTVTALNQSIIATDPNGSTEQLNGLIETDADVQPGDSGGPLYGAAGTVVGVDTAAASGGPVRSFAIPIATAEQIATRIGHSLTSTTVHQDSPAFLGVSVSDAQGGAAVLGVLANGPAAQAGVTAGTSSRPSRTGRSPRPRT